MTQQDTDALIPAGRRRGWHRRRDLRFVAVVVAFFAAYYGYGYATSGARISDRLHARLAEGPARVDIIVTTSFAPEAFHMGIYQEFGSMRGTRGNGSVLFRVKPSDVGWLSRRYWVENIDIAPPTP